MVGGRRSPRSHWRVRGASPGSIGLAVSTMALALLGSAPARGFVPFTDSFGGASVLVRWADSALPVRFVVNDRPLSLLPNLAPDSTLASAIEAAAETWRRVGAELLIGESVATTTAGADRVNLITFADTARNRDIVGDLLAGTLVFRTQGSEDIRILDTDVVFNPKYRFATSGRTDRFDVQATLTHELGNALGLDHTPLAGATMFPVAYEPDAYKRQLDTDDIAGLRTLYAKGDLPGVATGGISGQVLTAGGSPIFGAHVVASDSRGIAQVGALTDHDGRFSIPMLPPGAYQVYAEPLDGPMVPAFFVNPYHRDTANPILTEFQTTFAGGNDTPRTVEVSAGKSSSLEPIEVSEGTASIDPLGLAWARDQNSIFDDASVPLRPGEFAVLVVVGPGMDTLPSAGFRASGSDVILDTSRLSQGKLPNDLPYAIFAARVLSDAPPGSRSLYFSDGDQVAAYSGVIRVLAP